MQSFRLLLASLLLGMLPFCVSSLPAAAQPADTDAGTCHVSLFGTIGSVQGSQHFTLNAMRSALGSVTVNASGARVNANGLAIRPGVFAGLYGCIQQDGRQFKAHEVTLAPSARSYVAANHTARLIGTIYALNGQWIGVHTAYSGDVHVITSRRRGLHVGEHVRIRGLYDPITGTVTNATVQ